MSFVKHMFNHIPSAGASESPTQGTNVKHQRAVHVAQPPKRGGGGDLKAETEKGRGLCIGHPQPYMAGGLQPPSAEDEQKKAAAKSQGVIFVLENASLETAKVGKVCFNCSLHLVLHVPGFYFGAKHSTQFCAPKPQGHELACAHRLTSF